MKDQVDVIVLAVVILALLGCIVMVQNNATLTNALLGLLIGAVGILGGVAQSANKKNTANVGTANITETK